jgi:hypothetical protein
VNRRSSRTVTSARVHAKGQEFANSIAVERVCSMVQSSPCVFISAGLEQIADVSQVLGSGFVDDREIVMVKWLKCSNEAFVIFFQAQFPKFRNARGLNELW